MMRERFTSAPVLAGAAVLLASLGLYLATLAPSLTWGNNNIGVDGGELLAAANTFGIPHPPGYPTYVLLLKSFATLVPIGDFAHRGNLLSAVLGSVSVTLLYFVILRFGRALRPEAPETFRIAVAALAASIFATSPLFWSQAVITEVYTLNTVFAGSLLLIAAHLALPRPAEEGGDSRRTGPWLGLFGLLLGLGLGNHLTLLGIAGPLLLWLLATLGWRAVLTPWLVGPLVLGLGIYVYMPIRAAQDPPVNWGNADTFEGFRWMVSGRVYQDYAFDVPGSKVPGRVVNWVQLVFSQFNPPGMFGAVVGIAVLRTREIRFLGASLLSVAVISAYSIGYNTIDHKVLTIPTFMIFSVWIGIGSLAVFDNLATWLRSAEVSSLPGLIKRAAAHPLVLLSVVAFGALPLTSLILNYSSQNQRGDDRAYDYARDVFDRVPDGSVVLSKEENTSFSLWYMRYVEETDRDVAPIAIPLLQFDWYWRTLLSRYQDRLPAEVTTDVNKALERIIDENQGKARVFFTYMPRTLEQIYEFNDLGSLLEPGAKKKR